MYANLINAGLNTDSFALFNNKKHDWNMTFCYMHIVDDDGGYRNRTIAKSYLGKVTHNEGTRH